MQNNETAKLNNRIFDYKYGNPSTETSIAHKPHKEHIGPLDLWDLQQYY